MQNSGISEMSDEGMVVEDAKRNKSRFEYEPSLRNRGREEFVGKESHHSRGLSPYV